MALNPSTNATMAGRVTAPSAEYPYGSSKDETAPGANDGTPYFLARANDVFGFQQALLTEAGVVPSGNADTATASQYLDALKLIFAGFNGGVGNYEVILATGNYTAGTYAYPGGKSETDYARIEMVAARSGTNQFHSSTFITDKDIDGVTSWRLSAEAAFSDQGVIQRNSATDFTVSVTGLGQVATVIGYLK